MGSIGLFRMGAVLLEGLRGERGHVVGVAGLVDSLPFALKVVAPVVLEVVVLVLLIVLTEPLVGRPGE